MTEEEWDQLLSLREAMNTNMAALDAPTQQKFTELLVKSLRGKGNAPLCSENRT
jgi:hypothetical protein